MACYNNLNELLKNSDGKKSIELLSEANGCVAGCRAGVTYYQNTEYKKPGIHDDQEGFIVLKVSGMALIGDEEFAIEEGTAFIAPKGTPHTIKSNSNDEPVLVFWFHSAV